MNKEESRKAVDQAAKDIAEMVYEGLIKKIRTQIQIEEMNRTPIKLLSSDDWMKDQKNIKGETE